jgi:hypothetical protein
MNETIGALTDDASNDADGTPARSDDAPTDDDRVQAPGATRAGVEGAVNQVRKWIQNSTTCRPALSLAQPVSVITVPPVME